MQPSFSYVWLLIFRTSYYLSSYLSTIFHLSTWVTFLCQHYLSLWQQLVLERKSLTQYNTSSAKPSTLTAGPLFKWYKGSKIKTTSLYHCFRKGNCCSNFKSSEFCFQSWLTFLWALERCEDVGNLRSNAGSTLKRCRNYSPSNLYLILNPQTPLTLRITLKNNEW